MRMRVLFFHNPLMGHFLPLLPLARALREAGHSVAFASAPTMAASVEPEGFQLIPAGPTLEEGIEEMTRRTGVDIRSSDRTVEIVAEYFAGLRVELAMEQALAGSGEWAPDLIVFEHVDFVGPLVAAALKVPSACVAIDPDLGEVFLGALLDAARPRYLERGLPAPTRAPLGDLLIDLCPPSLQEVGRTAATGRIALRPEPHRAPDGTPRAKRAPGSGRPRVLVGFSTALEGELGTVLRSLSTLDIDLVATTGGAPADGLELEPGRVELFTFLPAAELLDGVAAVVHHGGSGATFAAAAHGAPAVVLPDTDGQEAQGRRVAASGAGLHLPIGQQDPEAVAAALLRVLTEPGFAAAARRLRDEIAAMPSASDVADHLATAFAP